MLGGVNTVRVQYRVGDETEWRDHDGSPLRVPSGLRIEWRARVDVTGGLSSDWSEPVGVRFA
jgi:hypothetical protein